MDLTERRRVRAAEPVRRGVLFRSWHQNVTVGEGTGNEQVIKLKGRDPSILMKLRQAIEIVVLTHETWDDTANSSSRHMTAQTLRGMAKQDNRAARALLAEHKIHLKGFDVPALPIGH